MEHLSGVPFPANQRRMPRLHPRLRGTWVEGALGNYANDASPARLLGILDRVVEFANQRNVPVFCGEFGVYIPNSAPEDRVLWYQFITNALDRRNISRTSWDYYGGFGVFNSESRGDFNSDLNVEVVRALGFTPPPQVPRRTGPLRDGFVLFDDYPSREVYAGFWGDANADFSLYETNTAEGEFAIRWGNVDRYNTFWFSFPRNGDFSVLAAGGFYLEFKARTERPVQFDVRFVNPERDSSPPWRMRYTINENILPPDGRWHTIRIPLSNMNEHGAWVNATQSWLNPRREFAWNNVDRLEFVAEHSDLRGRRIWFDSIKITR
jgi:endoglucanase